MQGGWEAVKEASIQLRYLFPTPTKGGTQRHDPDNLISFAKASVDGLQDGGILTDDRDVIYLPPTQEFSKNKLNTGQLQIDIRRIDGCELMMFDREEIVIIHCAIDDVYGLSQKGIELLAWFKELRDK